MTTMTPDEYRAAVQKGLPADIVLDGFLDKGGQGAVFKGTLAGQPTAVKVFDPSGDPQRLEREIDALQAIDCTNLVKVLRVEKKVNVATWTAPVVCYEFIDGGDLRTLLDPAAPPLTAEQVTAIAVQVGTAINELWKRRIVHRDIKPANILRSSSGRIVLADVGLGRHLDLASLTVAGGAVGTRGYMSPEQARGRKKLTVHSDVFSLGVTLFELAAKKHPWGHDQLAMLSSPPRVELRNTRQDLPTSLVKKILRTLALDPSSRPNDAKAFFEPPPSSDSGG